MLQELHIKNFAIIDELEINFTSHLNIITGETGAGKSILMGALGLILGERADTGSLLDKDTKCIVEGRFSGKQTAVTQFLQENNLDEEAELLIRREISPNGKSRAFVNDTPVTLVQLKILSSFLVDLHRQFDNLELNNKDFQLEVIDALAGHEKLMDEYKACFVRYRNLKNELSSLISAQEAAQKEFDYHQFLFNELDEAGFVENEIENLDAELKLLSNAGDIKEALSSAAYAFQDGEDPIVQQIRSIISKIGNIKEFVPELTSIEERLQSAYIELKDIASEIESVNSGIDFSEKRLDEINDRIGVAYALLKKHHVQTTEELLRVKDDLDQKLQHVSDLSHKIELLRNEEKELLAQLKRMARQISENRTKTSPGFVKKVNQLLVAVGMPNAAFKIDFAHHEEPHESGMDIVSFLFNANKTTFQPVHKVASGGELSRLMLIIKSLVARSINLPTLIFDEIDTGISGEAAKQVGNIIKDLSKDHQVLLITHQPQIAAKAFTHFYVFKEERAGKILTGIKTLNKQERIHAIATMLSGDKPTEAAFENAREMIN